MSQFLYQQMIIDHSKNPKGYKKDPCGCCTDAKNPMCGDHIKMCAEVKDGVVVDMSYYAEGCSISMAAASVLVSTMKGESISVFKSTMDAYLKMLKGESYENLPKKLSIFSGVCQYPMRVKCASFAWHAALDAIEKAMKPVALSDKVITYWKNQVMDNQGVGIYLGFKQIGCMGWQFIPQVVNEQPIDSETHVFSNLKVYIDPSVTELIAGTKVVFQENDLGEGKVVYEHPKAKQHCGCGESFFMEEQ